MPPSPSRAIYFRNFIFGGEDSLVSTVGLLAGIAVGGVPRADIVLTGIVLIFVEALSMAVGSFLSESSTEEYVAQAVVSANMPIAGGVVMFFSYFFLGFIPLSPYIFIETPTAVWMSIIFSMISLGLLGVFSGREAKVSLGRSALKMIILGGAAILVGTVVGRLVRL